jgi:hypothetical protein
MAGVESSAQALPPANRAEEVMAVTAIILEIFLFIKV